LLILYYFTLEKCLIYHSIARTYYKTLLLRDQLKEEKKSALSDQPSLMPSNYSQSSIIGLAQLKPFAMPNPVNSIPKSLMSTVNHYLNTLNLHLKMFSHIKSIAMIFSVFSHFLNSILNVTKEKKEKLRPPK